MIKKIVIPITLTLLVIILGLVIMYKFGVFNRYDVYNDVKYGDNERNVFDLYLPKNYKENGLILYIHGGAWIAGDKESYQNDMKKHAKKGIACAAINYRYASSTVSCDDILDDVDKALIKIKEKAKEEGIDLDKMILTGHSAGAHLSLMYAYKYQNTAVIKPVAVVSFAGPTDLTDEMYYTNFPTVYELFSYMIGKEFNENTKDDVRDDLLHVSPISYVNTNSVPTIIVQGEIDNIVSLNNGKSLENVLKENNVEYYAYYYPNSGHGLEHDKDINKQVYDKFNEFILKYLK